MSEFVRQNSPTPEVEEPGFDFLGFLWRRSWLAVFFGTIGAAAAYYYYLQQPVRYKARSQVLVIKQQANLPVSSVNGFDASGQRDPLENDARMIMSEGIVGPAIQAGKLNELNSLTGSSNLVQAILQDLSVDRPSINGDFLEISYRGSDPEDCAKVVNAVVASYDQQLKKAYADVSTVTANLLNSAKEEWQKNLKKSEDEYAEFRKTASLLYVGNSVTSVSQNRMADIESQRSKVLIAQTGVQAQLDSIQKAINRGGSREAVMLMVEAFSEQNNKDSQAATTSPTILAARELFSMQLEEALLLEEVGPDHPKVKQIRKRIDLTRSFLQEQSNAEGAVIPAETKNKDFLAIYIESLQQQLQAGAEQLSQLNALFEREAETSKKQTDFQINDRRLQNEIAISQQAFNTIFDRLKDVDLATKGGQYSTQVMSPATRGVQFEPVFSKTIILGTVIGALSGLLLGFLVESADKSFRTPNEISQTLHLPLIGISPQFQLGRNNKDSLIAPVIVTIHRPRSQSAEAFRGLRTHLLAATRGDDTHKVLLVTSPEPGDGKSTISGNLAVTLAQSGRSVLLIDADMRRPTINALFGLKRESGLSDLLDDSASEVDDMIKTISFEGNTLHVMTSGVCPTDPGERLLSSRFDELLMELRKKFEWIIIDSPPVLAVTDSATMSRLADGVILVVRMNGRTRMAAVRAAESLHTLGAKMLGVIANGIDPTRHSGYGYQYGVYGAGSKASKYYAESSDGR